MNEVQTRLCEVLMQGLEECAELALETPPRVDLIDDLVDALAPLPRAIVDQRRLRLSPLANALGRHRRRHADCPHAYKRVVEGLRAPAWTPWGRERVRPAAAAGDTRLSEPQLYLLAVERSLLYALQTAAWEAEIGRLRALAEVVRGLPPLAETRELASVVALAGPSGPYASTGCPHWKVFQPLTIPADEMIRKYLG